MRHFPNKWLLAALIATTATSLPAQRPPRGFAVRITPRMHAFLDSISLHSALTALPASPAERRTSRVFVVEFDSTGKAQPVVPAVPRAMPVSYHDAVAPLIQAALRPIAPSRTGWRSLILVDAGNEPKIQEVRLPAREPRVANARALEQVLFEHAQRLVNLDTTLIGRTLRVHISMRVDEEGIASASGIALSSDIAAVDSAALDAVRVIRFHPGLLDEEPAPARVVLPIRFVFPVEQ
jgi:TonB family protein